jgi:protein SCO1/2
MRSLLPLVLTIACAACSNRGHDTAGAGSSRVESTNLATEPPSASIYPLRVALRDHDGEPIGADVFRGHPVIVTMFYGSCPAACPLLVSYIKQVEASLAPDVRANLRVLVVSFDAERDTPEALRELARAHHVDTSRWRFAAGPDDDVRVLANALGIHYRKGEGGVFSHNSVVSVLDDDGRIIVRSDNPRDDVVRLATAVTRVSTAARSRLPRG